MAAKRRARRCLVFCALVAIARTASAQVEFRPLGFLPGETSSEAADISANGEVIVGQSGATAFRWTEAEGMQPLASFPDASNQRADAVSGDGSVAAGWALHDLVEREAVRWSDAGVSALGSLTTSYIDVSAADVSRDGSVVVGRSSSDAAGGYEAFRWTPAGGMVGLGMPAGHVASEAHAVSANGTIVVGQSQGSELEAFRWTQSDGMQSLGFPPGPPDPSSRSSFASAISASGAVVLGSASHFFDDGRPTLVQLFRWTPARGMQGLGVRMLPDATTSDGAIVVGWLQAPGGKARLWDALHGLRELEQVLADAGIDISGWTATRATGISDDGTRIVGFGRNPSGSREAFLVTLPAPTPQCGNGVDDDGDGAVDLHDPGCPVADAASENPRCDDGLDNDRDGLVDFDDPICRPGWPYSEAAACGFGAEIAGVLALLGLLRRRNPRGR